MACSLTESNGRIHSLLYLNYLDSKNVHNFYLGGEPNHPNVIYINFSFLKAFKSKVLRKKDQHISCFRGTNSVVCRNRKRILFKIRTPLTYLLRNYFYANNRSLIKELNDYISENNIDAIVLWGGNTPFLYELALKISQANNIKLIIHTGEDYPLKNYNFISRGPSIFFRRYQKQLRNYAMDAYAFSSLNVYANEELLKAYEGAFKTANNNVIFFSSCLIEAERTNSPITKIVYAGNLNVDRFESITKIAKYLEKFQDVKIYVYGNVNKRILKKIKLYKNISYQGVLNYEELKNKLREADMLLHIEGFSKYYIKDCKFAFSTKISDYYMLNKPVFVFGPKEISGIKFANNLNSDFTATSLNELNKLDAILNGTKKYNVNYTKIKNMFDSHMNSKKMFELLEN